jgi:hypothetical protein
VTAESERYSPAAMLLRQERAGVSIKIAPERLRALAGDGEAAKKRG